MKRLLTLVACLFVAGCGTNSQPPVPQSAARPEGYAYAAPPKTISRSPGYRISVNGEHLIEGFEGFVSCPYWDSYGGVWTRGYGETEGIHSGSSCISQSNAQARLGYLVEARYQWAVNELGPGLNQNQVDALDSFAWNLGAGIFYGTLRSDLVSHQYWAATRLMLQYDHAGGAVLSGLQRRRQQEVALFLKAPARVATNYLARDIRLRTELRYLLNRHHCRTTRRPSRMCLYWLHEGRVVNIRIHKGY